jgi:hypothetical protein
MGTDLGGQIRELIEGRARPVSFSDITGREPVTAPRPRPARSGLRSGGATVIAAAAAVTAVAAGAVVAAQLVGAGGQPRPGGSAVLTAATVRHVAAASGVALAHVGHLRITYSDSGSGGRAAGTDDITFSGQDWNYVTNQTAPPNGSSVNRFVGGRLYYYGRGFVGPNWHPGDPLRWVRETNPRELRHVTSVTAPDPRGLLRVLDPAARFVRVGYQVIAGVRVEQLRATRLARLPGLDALAGDARPTGRVTSLDVWVDSHGVIRRLRVTSQKTVTVAPPRCQWLVTTKSGATGRLRDEVLKKRLEREVLDQLRKSGAGTGSRGALLHGRPVLQVGGLVVHGKLAYGCVRTSSPVPGAGGERRAVTRASATVSFLDIGQPETIKAPAHSVPVYGRG